MSSKNWLDENVSKEISDYVYNIKIKVGNRSPLITNIKKLLEINYEEIETDLEHLPSILYFFESLLSDQKIVVSTLEYKYESSKSQFFSKMIEKAETDNIKLSVTMIKELVCSDENVLKTAVERIIEQQKLERLRAIVNCLVKKSEHLRSLAGFKREEKGRQ